VADLPTAAAERAFSFGPFRFLPTRQLLLEGETPVRLGSRAVELLAALVERPGELVSKSELFARVWPNTVVEESNLKVHIAALRRALGEGQPGRRYVATVSGRGYRFVAPVGISEPEMPPPRGTAEPLAHNLPAASTRTIGRAGTIDALRRQLPQRRFITVVGPSGIGKTTVALATVEALLETYEHGVCFVDLAPLGDPQFVPSTLASALGLTIPGNGVSALTSYLRDKRMLILLDSCDHVIETAAMLAEQIVSAAPGLHVLTTSREPLRAKGEHVHRLSPFENPPASPSLTAAEALAFPAVQLFVERAAACLEGFQLSDADAPIVAEICRKLEGIALAIELAATRIDAFGLRELSELLNDRFRLLKQGRRTTLARHRSLAAALDWSYDFLPPSEQVLLRRFSVFAGDFTLESACAVVSDRSIAGAEIVEGVANLVAKSLLTADVGDVVVRYRLLETTRAYAFQKLAESGEADLVARRHAEHHRDLFGRAEAEWDAKPTAEWLADYGRKIDNVRAALVWAFSEAGDASVGVALTIAAIPLWMHLSLMEECRAGIERALAGYETSPGRNDRDEMRLYAGLAGALLHARGPLPETDIAWAKALQIAERLPDSEYQLRCLWGVAICRFYVADYRAALGFARRFRKLAGEKGDAAARLSGDRLAATTQHYLGDQTAARRQLERALREHPGPFPRAHIARFLYDQRVATQDALAVVLWLQGCPDQAVRKAQETFEEAQATGHVLTLCSALAQAVCPVALYVGNLALAEHRLAMLLGHLAKQPMSVSKALAFSLQGTLRVMKGDVTAAPLIRDALTELRGARYRLRYPAHLGTLALALGLAGNASQARRTIDEALESAMQSEEFWCLAELLRIKGELLEREGSAAAIGAAEDQYRQALDWARRQEALSWELRAATTLARLQHRQGQTKEAERLLCPVYARFREGFETRDLIIARMLIDDLRAALPSA
jgi:predicted ATPase/DNA-binding winged helix-turn-helix (wHTH) protein